jgi:Uncharacterised protein family (UPF0158)
MALDAVHLDRPRRLRVDVAEIAVTMDDASDVIRQFLDLETGEIAVITEESRAELNAIEAEVYDDDGNERVPFDEALRRRNLPPWLADAVREAAAIDNGFGTRFVEIPTIESSDAYRDMENFIETVEDAGLRDRLWRAIDGRGAFRRFKEVLSEDPAECDRWYAFKSARERDRALDWLESEGIEPIEEQTSRCAR